jgi:hypothetical protein
MRNTKNKGTKDPAEVKTERTHLWVTPDLNTEVQVFAKQHKYKSAAAVVEAGLSLLKQAKGAVTA